MINDGPQQLIWQSQRKRQGVVDGGYQLRWGNVADGLQQYGQDFQICWDIGSIRALARRSGRRNRMSEGMGVWVLVLEALYFRCFRVFPHLTSHVCKEKWFDPRIKHRDMKETYRSEAMIKMSLLTVKYLPLPHPTSSPMEPGDNSRRKRSTMGHGWYTSETSSFIDRYRG